MTIQEIKNTPEIVDFMLDKSVIADSRIKLHKRLEEICELAIKALEQEPSREFEDYENEIEDLHNRLDIAEYDKERLREEVTNLEAKIKALEQEPLCDRLAREYISKVKYCDECFASTFCTINGLRNSRVPQSYCIENIKKYSESKSEE